MSRQKKIFSQFVVLLVEPKYSGNIGAVARSMKNFDFETLYLVDPCELDADCYARAMHAQDLVDHARIFSSFDEACKDIDYLVATSSIETTSEKRHLRQPFILDEFAKKIFDVEGRIGLVFGREDYGLFNEEIAACDVMVKIPTSPSYPSLNLSHAVTVVLYSLYTHNVEYKRKRKLSKVEKEMLFRFFSDLLDEIDYPKHKKENTKIMFKRMMGRALPSQWEYHTLMGVLSGALEKIKKK
ncbi:MAG: RNA methyltransferase [Candidatus Thermoplasmatota archaeon]